jgi:hypothetical protein
MGAYVTGNFQPRARLDAQFWMDKVGIVHCSVTVAFRLYLVKIVQTLTN